MAYPFLVSLVVGVFVRAVLSGSTIAQWLADRNEISTPLTSWKRGGFYKKIYNIAVLSPNQTTTRSRTLTWPKTK